MNQKAHRHIEADYTNPRQLQHPRFILCSHGSSCFQHISSHDTSLYPRTGKLYLLFSFSGLLTHFLLWPAGSIVCVGVQSLQGLKVLHYKDTDLENTSYDAADVRLIEVHFGGEKKSLALRHPFLNQPTKN